MSVWPNRIIILLSWLGFYIASVLSYSHFADRLVPCSQGASCAAVAISAFSKLGPIPVAYLGLGGYVTILGLAIYRFINPKAWALTAKIGFFMSIAGFLFSCWLTFASLAFLHTTCEWCLGSFATMIGLFLSHAWLMQTEAPANPGRGINWGVIAVGGIAAIAGFGAVSAGMVADKGGTDLDLGTLKVQDIIGPDYKRQGNKDAKVTIVEFADFNCPACRAAYPRMHAEFAKFEGRLQYVYRSLPLQGVPGHESSLMAARLAEIAAQKGKYWQYVDEIFKPENTERIKDADGIGLKKLITDMGIDAKYVEDALNNKEDKSVYALADDIGIATRSLGLTGTPTFILIAQGTPTKKVAFEDIDTLLSKEPYKGLVAK